MTEDQQENYFLEIHSSLAKQIDRLNRIEADFETVKSVLAEFGFEHLTKDKLPKDLQK